MDYQTHAFTEPQTKCRNGSRFEKTRFCEEFTENRYVYLGIWSVNSELENYVVYLGCPTTVKVTPSSGPYKAGDVLTCMSDGYPEPSYTWTDSVSGVVVSNGPNVTLTNSSSILNCTATVSATDACSASVVVHRSGMLRGLSVHEHVKKW